MTDQPFFIAAVAIFVLAIPLVLGVIPRNWGYGIRTAKTLSDADIWHRANRFGGWCLLASSLIYLVVAKLVPYAGPAGDFSIWWLHLGALLLPIAASVVLINRYNKRL